jgi:hypothetical protein
LRPALVPRPYKHNSSRRFGYVKTPDKTTTETAYYLLSTALSPERFNEVVRQHWGVENRLHWRLDVVMTEDQDRTRLGNGPHNLAVLRHMQKEGPKGSLRGKFKRAAWNEGFLTKLLSLFCNAIARAAKLVVDLAGGSPADGTCPVAVVAITGSEKSDRLAGSPVVKVSVG